MQPSDAPVLLYLWDKRTFYLSAFAEPLQLSQAAAMLLVGLDDELLIHSQGTALRCRSVLLPPGLELVVDSRGSRVALCYLDVFGEDFALLAPRMKDGAALVLGGLLAVFTVAIAVNLIRGIDMACGCFTVSETAERIGWWNVVRNLALLALTWWAARTLPRDGHRPRGGSAPAA